MKIFNVQAKYFFTDIEEPSVDYKIVINICDLIDCCHTDTNRLLNNLYSKPKKVYYEWASGKLNYLNDGLFVLGGVQFVPIFTYFTVCNMLCINRPKAIDNLQPFKYDSFEVCCKKMKSYCDKNDIHQIRTTVFGKDILEGDWSKILSILQKTCNDLDLYIYE